MKFISARIAPTVPARRHATSTVLELFNSDNDNSLTYSIGKIRLFVIGNRWGARNECGLPIDNKLFRCFQIIDSFFYFLIYNVSLALWQNRENRLNFHRGFGKKYRVISFANLSDWIFNQHLRKYQHIQQTTTFQQTDLVILKYNWSVIVKDLAL